MGKLQFCRICRTDKNLKYTVKELRQLNKQQLQFGQGTQEGQGTTDRASKKLLLTTRTLGNICRVCDERIQIFHHLDDGDHDIGSDIEIDVVDATNTTLPSRLVINNLQNGVGATSSQQQPQRTRPDSPVIVDDDDMLYNLFMQKVDQQRQFKRQLQQQQQHVQQTLPLPPQQLLQHQQQHQLQLPPQFVTQFQSPYTPPQSTAGGSEGDESKIIEVLTSRESTPASSVAPLTTTTPGMIDQHGHRIVAIIDLDDGDDNEPKTTEEILRNASEKDTGFLTPSTSSSNDLSLSETTAEERGLVTPVKNYVQNNKLMPCVSQTSLTLQPPHPPEDDDDDEEIVFRKVEPEQQQTPTSSSKKRKRKSYDEKQLRLVASLSLLSSDSEAEDSPTKLANKKPLNTAVSSPPVKAIVNSHPSFSCNLCNIILPDAESLSVHERIHQGVKCPVCQFGFQQVQRLVHHMRRKHREYNGEVLCEKPRIGQDSCMTIRLRYMQRTTYYECQLCGRIDCIFREHKEHIIDKHPIESKSLKDPMMKQLKCPVCKLKCGAQYLSLCRHLITNHEYAEYKGNLRELVHVSAFGWNAARQEEVAKTAKIYQFIKRKTFFFECKICQKVVAGYLNHLRHLTHHENMIKHKTKVNAATSLENSPSNLNKTHSTPHTSSSTISKKIPEKLEKVKEKNRKLKIKENSITKSKISINSKKSQKLKKSLQLEKSQKCEISKIATKKTRRSATEAIAKLKCKSPESLPKLRIKIKLKPKDKGKLPKNTNKTAATVTAPATTVPKATKGRPKKDSAAAIKRKLKESLQIKKVKVKPPIKQIDLQRYRCKYCLKKFKGFRLFNLHLLRQHNAIEYDTCKKCNKTFAITRSMEHKCFHDTVTNQQKRKFVKITLKPQENCNEILEISDDSIELEIQDNFESHLQCSEEQDQQQWLKDLLKLSNISKTNDANSLTSSSSSKSSSLDLTKTNTALFVIPQNINVTCCYCLHLFASQDDLDQHTQQQHHHQPHDHIHSQKPEILLKYKPLKC